MRWPQQIPYGAALTIRGGVAIYLLAIVSSANATEMDCERFQAIPPDAVFIGYSRTAEDALRPAALLADNALLPYDGQGVSSGMALYGLLSGADTVAERMAPHTSHLGEDYCVYPATLSINPMEEWEIWTTEPALRAELGYPSVKEREQFRQHESGCVEQGDPPRCVRPSLLAVSDLDEDGAIEYWYSFPYRWDTGFRVAEVVEGELATLVAVCPGCSD